MDAHTERRVVTAVFIDVVGSTDVLVGVGPEVMRRRLGVAFEEMSARIEEYGGTVEKFVGDAIFAIFGAPAAHVDDPQRALRAALACRDWSTEAIAPDRLAIRVGLETGEALVDMSALERRERMAIGAPVNIAARLQQQAEPGEILVGPACHATTATLGAFVPLGTKALKGIGETETWKLVAISSMSLAAEIPLIGRAQERARLINAAEHALGDGQANLAVIVGEPGLGKSRLANEVATGVSAGRPVRVIELRCRPEGEAGANSPLRQLFDAIDLGPSSELPALAHSAGVTPDPDLLKVTRFEQRELISEAWRRSLARIATDQPLVLLIEDIHWADPVLVRMVDHLTDDLPSPIFVIATARPEFAESAHVRSLEGRVTIALEPLDEAAAVELARAVRGAVPGLDKAAGNPLFIVELARSQAVASELPLTIQSAIAARLDELAPDDRHLLQHVSVVGESFDVRDAALLDDRETPAIAAMLGRITHLGFLTPVGSRYRFHHALVRDVAYARLPVDKRMALHLRYADHGARPDDIESRAFHLWEAVKPPDAEWVWEDAEALASLRARAFRAQLDAGARLESQNQYERAGTTYANAVQLATDPQQLGLARSEMGRALARQGRGDDAWRERSAALAAYGEAAVDPPAELYADMLELATMNWGYFKSLPSDDEVMRLLADGERVARASGDDVSLARLLAERAAFSGDVSGIEEVVRLAQSDDGVRFADAAHRSAMILLWAGQVRRSANLYSLVFDEFAPRGGRFNEPEALSWYGLAAFLEGDLELATSIAGRAAEDADKGRSVHTHSHVIALQALIAFGRGDWPLVEDRWVALAELIARNPDAGFCLLGTATIGYGAVAQIERGEPVTTDIREAVRRLEESERICAASIMLAQVMSGNQNALDDGLAAYESDLGLYDRAAVWDVPWLSPAIAEVMLGRWSDLDVVLARLDECAAGGSRVAEAVASAVREERAASLDSGGDAPVHSLLRGLGYTGLSDLLRFRVSQSSAR
jgi:class 3 adenylate cyclase/tetratricopeptide (TPR) repeat protein